MISGQNLPPRISGKILAYRDFRNDRTVKGFVRVCLAGASRGLVVFRPSLRRDLL